MTRTLLLLVALYVVWRLATLWGRSRERAYRGEMRGRGRVYGARAVARCSRCNRYLAADEVRWEGRWPARRAVCADGCTIDVDATLVE